MKFGFRVPSLKKRISARLSVKRYVRHSMGLKMPRGMGMFTNPKKALYNKVYRKTTFGIEDMGKGKAPLFAESNSKTLSKSLTPPVSVKKTGASFWVISIVGSVFLFAIGWGWLWVPFLIVWFFIYHGHTPEGKQLQAIKMSDKLYEKGQKQQSIELLLPFGKEENYEIRKRLGYRYCVLGKYAEAEQHLQFANEKNATDMEIIYAYAVTLFNLKKFAESLRVLSALSDGVQTEPLFANILGGNYHGMGKDDVAIEIYKKCISRKQNIGGEEISIAINLARILIAKGSKAEAKKYVLKVLAVSPTHPEATELLDKC